MCLAFPIIGGLASFALIGFVQPLSQLLGVVLSLIAVAWYLLYAGNVDLKDQMYTGNVDLKDQMYTGNVDLKDQI